MYHLVGDIDCGGGCAHWEVEGEWKISVPSPQFCYELKAAPKIVSSCFQKEKNEFFKKFNLYSFQRPSHIKLDK